MVLGYLILDEAGVRLYTDETKFSSALRQGLEADDVEFRPYLSVFEDVKAIGTERTVVVDPNKVSYAILRNLPETARLLEQPNPTELPKAVKTTAECENERMAHIKDGVALTRFMKWLKEHVGKERITEISAAEKLEQLRAQQEHYLGPSFDPIFGYGPHGAIVHYSATEKSDAALEPRAYYCRIPADTIWRVPQM